MIRSMHLILGSSIIDGLSGLVALFKNPVSLDRTIILDISDFETLVWAWIF